MVANLQPHSRISNSASFLHPNSQDGRWLKRRAFGLQSSHPSGEERRARNCGPGAVEGVRVYAMSI